MNENEKKIVDLITAENGIITIKQVAEKLYLSESTVSKVARKHNLRLIRAKREIYDKRYQPCKNRPEGCFECTYRDCICNSKKNTAESKYWDEKT